jgi:hypothetical protein
VWILKARNGYTKKKNTFDKGQEDEGRREGPEERKKND